MAAYPLTETDANNALNLASLSVISPKHDQAAPDEVRLSRGLSDDKVWIESPTDTSLIGLILRVPGHRLDLSRKQRSIPVSGLKRFVLDVYHDSILKSRYWPVDASPELTREIAEIIEESESGKAIRETPSVQPPAWLDHNGFSPRNYQYQGALWLASQRRGILAYDMGLGKTGIALTAFKLLRKKMPEARAIVICPAGIKNVWKNEIQKFTDLSFAIVEGTKEQRIQAYAQDADILVMSYEHLSIDAPYVHQRVNGTQCLIVDEATYLKSLEAQRTKGFREIIGLAQYCWFLTGTPFMNNLKELYNLITLLDPSFLEPWWIFEEKYMGTDLLGQVMDRSKGLKALRDRLAPIMFRKGKSEVAEELPEKIFEEIRVVLSDEQKVAYDQIRARLVVNLSKEATNPKWLKVTNALSEMTRLKQICDSLQLLGLPETENPKIIELKRLLNEDLRDEKVIVFTQYQQMAKILERELKPFRPIMLSGSVPVEGRESLVNQFQSDPANRVFLTTTAGGMGLTLTAASAVIFFDTLWNPKMMDQIIGRADRIGNTNKTILVLNLIAENTIEKKILEMTKTKSDLFDSVMGHGDIPQAVLERFTPEEVGGLVGITPTGA